MKGGHGVILVVQTSLAADSLLQQEPRGPGSWRGRSNSPLEMWAWEGGGSPGTLAAKQTSEKCWRQKTAALPPANTANTGLYVDQRDKSVTRQFPFHTLQDHSLCCAVQPRQLCDGAGCCLMLLERAGPDSPGVMLPRTSPWRGSRKQPSAWKINSGSHKRLRQRAGLILCRF